MDERAAETASGKHDTGAALRMLEIFGSVGATAFDVTLTDLAGQKTGYQPNRSLAELRRTIGARLDTATRLKTNFIIRPRSTTTTLIQLDDIDGARAEQLAPWAFIVFQTSPAKHQAWVAVEKDAPKDFKLRLKRGTGADPTASEATRIAGSLNLKPAYAPAFPVVRITHATPANVTSCARLELAGLVAPREEPQQPPAGVPQFPPPRPAAGRSWPDYQQALRGAPLKQDGSGPDRSKADYMFSKWAAQRGWSIEEIAAKLPEVSTKAQERIRDRDEGYPLLTARNATAAVERERSRSPRFKSTARPH